MNTIKVLPITDPAITRPLWSVMIPTYNCSGYLKETIESVIMQDRGVENMEIWVVDDCSTINPEDMVKQLGKGRINFYRQEQNVGQLNNFNTCLNLACGKIIHLLHGDDFIHNGFYAKIESPLMADENIGAAFTGNNIVDTNSNVTLVSDLLSNEPGVLHNFLSLITRKQLIQTPSIVVKREVYEKLGGFSRDLSWLEDWEMWIRIACHYKFYYEPATLASYRLHRASNTEDSIQTGRFVKDALACIIVYSGYLNLPKKSKQEIINAAKQHYLNYSKTESRKRLSALILVRSFPLVYDFSSFISLIKEMARISIKAGIKKFNVFL